MNYPNFEKSAGMIESVYKENQALSLVEKITERNMRALDQINTVIGDLYEQIDFVLTPVGPEASDDPGMKYPDEDMVSPYERQAIAHHRELEHILGRLQTLTRRVAITRS